MELTGQQSVYNIPELRDRLWRTVLIADMKISRNPRECLITYGLGSCVAVSAYDPVRKVGGLLHYLLPYGDEKGGRFNPLRYGDLGFIRLLKALRCAGAEPRRLVIKAIGGAAINQPDDEFSIGWQNCRVLLEMLRRVRLPLAARDLGGTRSRTAALLIETGQVLIRQQGCLVEI